MNELRDRLVELYQAAIAGAGVEHLTTAAIERLHIERRRRVWLYSFGKAAHSMATAAVDALHRGLAEIAGGVVVDAAVSEPIVGTIATLAGDHPVPARRSFTAAARIRENIAKKRGNDLAIVLVSGGTSSLIGAPVRGLSEADLSKLFELLHGAGLDIRQMNAVRKRFLAWGAGRMALSLAPAPTVCFAVSDVPGDDLGTIGSGPCVPDPTTAAAVTEILQKSGLYGKIAQSFKQHLLDTLRGVTPETPKATHPAFAHIKASVIASNVSALSAVADAARRLGYATVVQSESLQGDAAAAGERVASALLDIRSRASPGSVHCSVWGGETTVKLPQGSPVGGRCQELALAAAQRLAGAGDASVGIALLSAGTDGRDGTTDAAGAIVDASTWKDIAASGRDPAAALASHDSHAALAAARSLFAPGPTRTNVMDVTIGIVSAN